MSVIIRLQNLPWSANALDIRRFFHNLNIPDGGVHIVGGDAGDAFIAFGTDEDARKAMRLDGNLVNGSPLKLYLSSKQEMQNVIAVARSTATAPDAFPRQPPAAAPEMGGPLGPPQGQPGPGFPERGAPAGPPSGPPGYPPHESRSMAPPDPRAGPPQPGPPRHIDSGYSQGQYNNQPQGGFVPDQRGMTPQHGNLGGPAPQGGSFNQGPPQGGWEAPVSARPSGNPEFRPQEPTQYGRDASGPPFPRDGMQSQSGFGRDNLRRDNPPSSREPQGNLRDNARQGGFRDGPGGQGNLRDEPRQGGFRNGQRAGGFRDESRPGAGGFRDEPRPAAGFRDEPRPAGGFRDEQRAPGGFRDEPRPVGGLRDEPRPVGSLRDEPRPVGGFRDEPRAAAGFRNEPRPTAGFRNEPRPSGFNKEEPPRPAGFRDEPRPLVGAGGGGFRDEPRPLGGGFRDEPRPVAGFRDEPRPVGGFRDEPRPAGGFRDEPRGPGGFRNDQRSGGFRDEVRPSGGFRDEPRPDGNFRNEPRPSGAFRDEPRQGGFRDEPQQGGFRDGPGQAGFQNGVPGSFRDGPPQAGFRDDQRAGNFRDNQRPQGFNRDGPTPPFGRDMPLDRPRGENLGGGPPFHADNRPMGGFPRDGPQPGSFGQPMPGSDADVPGGFRDIKPIADFGRDQQGDWPGPRAAVEPPRDFGSPGNYQKDFDRGRDQKRSRPGFGSDRDHRGSRERGRPREERRDDRRQAEKRPLKGPSSCCAFLKGMPFTVSFKEVRRFFAGLEIPRDGLKLINDEMGRRNGTGYCKFASCEDFDKGMKMHGKYMGDRYVEVMQISLEEFEAAKDSVVPGNKPRPERSGSPPHKRSRSDSPARNNKSSSSQDCCVVMKNLPARVERQEIRDFFKGMRIKKTGGVYIEYDNDGRTLGNAYIEFESYKDFKGALNFHKERLGSKSVQVYAIKKSELESAVAKHKDKQKAIPKVKEDSTGPIHSPAPAKDRDERKTSYFCVKISGLPYTASVKEVKDFFSGLEIAPRGVHIVFNASGQAAGDAFVEFVTASDCEKALQKDKQYMGRRYILVQPITKAEMLDLLKQSREFKEDRRGGGGGGGGGGPVRSRPDIDGAHLEGIGRSNCVVGLQNLDFSANIDEILNFFRGYGAIPDSVRIHYDDGGKPTGDALVAFHDPEGAQRAIRDMHNQQLRRRNVQLYLAQ